jgi:hypothetical protein
MSTDEIREPQADQLKEAFATHKQMLREAMEKSAESLRQALAVQQGAYEQLNQQVSDQIRPGAPARPDPQFGSLTTEFVANAYRRAREMFEEVGRSVNESQEKSAVATAIHPAPGPPVSPAEAGALAASAMMMSQATAHLNEAMESAVQAMNARLSQPMNVPGSRDVATPPQTRML